MLQRAVERRQPEEPVTAACAVCRLQCGYAGVLVADVWAVSVEVRPEETGAEQGW